MTINAQALPIKQERAKDKLTIAHVLFLLFWITKPFYLKASGTMQISDGIFVLSFFAWIIQNKWRVIIDKKDFYFIGFVGCVFIINGVYYLLHQQRGFLMSSAYYLYNLMVILVVRDFKSNRTFLKALLIASCINLLVQLIVLVLGKGSYVLAKLRFMGTFNDPNQFSFSMFTAFLIIYTLATYLKDREDSNGQTIMFLSFILSFFFIFQGSSTGMLLGIVSFTLLAALVFIWGSNTPGRVVIRFIALIFIMLIILSLVIPGGLSPDISELESDNFLMKRLEAKLSDIESGGLGAAAGNRGIDKVFNNLKNIFFGAGEGYFERYPESPFEIHSTFISILFSYGILPFLILIKWIWDNVKNTNKALIPVFIALLIESFTLAHQRQPVFWILILLGSLEFHSREVPQHKLEVKL